MTNLYYSINNICDENILFIFIISCNKVVSNIFIIILIIIIFILL